MFVYIWRGGAAWRSGGKILGALTFLKRFLAAEMIRETGADYKKAIVAVAIAGGVGATVAGAGLLAYRLWRRRCRNIRETKSDKRSEPVHSVSKEQLQYEI